MDFFELDSNVGLFFLPLPPRRDYNPTIIRTLTHKLIHNTLLSILWDSVTCYSIAPTR